jgi:hypothetical protein
MKKGRKLLILFLILILSMSLFSCDLLSSSTNTDIDTDVIKVAKPEFNLAMQNYDELSAKNSVFEGKVVMSMYGKVDEDTNEATTYTAGQELTLNRIENDNKIYIDGDLNSCDVCDYISTLVGFVRSNLLDDNEIFDVSTTEYINDALGYLLGTNSLEFEIGYDGVGTYNAISNVITDGETKTSSVAINDEYINYELTNNLIDAEINLSDYLMYSTFVNFGSASDWIDCDSASKYYTDTIADYEMSASSEKIYDFIFGLVEDYIVSLDIDAYEAEIQKYDECIGYIKNWVSVGESSVYATVNEDNLPVNMDTSIQINININKDELKTVIYTLIGDSDKADKIWTTSLEFLLSSMFRGTNGETGLIGISFDISMKEAYNYDDESVSLENVNQALFIDAEEFVEGRVSYTIENMANLIVDEEIEQEELE